MSGIMDIYAKKGQLVRFLGKNGYDCDLKFALKKLEVGKIYTIEYTDVHNWSTDVYLQEFPKESFNAAMFEDVLICK